ncbi:BRO family protein [Actinomadura meyerae]|uniref:BRO-N domain-containing protein n=1 Tax=Actinomadura meyerae TaxID=240840 RepID=UPI001C52F022
MGDPEAPWFVASDVCRILGYDRARNALRMLDDDEKGAHLLSTPGTLGLPSRFRRATGSVT